MKQKAKVEIYTWNHCPYCQRTLQLFNSKEIKYIQYKIDGDETARDKMSVRANGRRTVPQVFIDDSHIGGCDDTHALDSNGELDKLVFET